MTIKRIILGLFLATLLISCGSTQVEQVSEPAPRRTEKPAWVPNPENFYPSDEYISALGQGYTRSEAAANAEIELGKYFGQNVRSSTTGRENYSAVNNSYSSSKSIEKEYEVTVDVDLVAAKKTKPWYDFDTEEYYVCAYLDREEAFDIFKPNVINVKNDFDSFYTQCIRERDFFKQLSLLQTTQKIGEEYFKVLQQGTLLSPAVANIYKEDFKRISDVNVMLKDLQLNASVKVEVVNDYGHKIRDYVAKVIGNNGFIISDTDYHYIVYVEVDQNQIVDDYSGIIAATPSVTISLEDKRTGDIPFTYTANVQERIKSYKQQQIDAKSYNAIERELENSLDSELKAFFNSKK